MLQLGTPQAAKNRLQVAVVVWQGGMCSQLSSLGMWNSPDSKWTLSHLFPLQLQEQFPDKQASGTLSHCT